MLKIYRRVRMRKPVFRSLFPGLFVFTILFLPLAARAQERGTPFDTGFTAIQTLFTGTITKIASLVVIVIGAYAFAHGEPGAKKTSARPAGTGPRRVFQRGLEYGKAEGKGYLAPGPESPVLD